ncbi:Wall-associated receptor kinase-like [Thalictrum thalictroides]|uniref:Wall-associated receptor kinase-like n=1 Tax=Thalictrum thalictroides TaxID=46969 RepID=A0A7J6W3V3_THATH|nr:Wall-associated receptor kinase-like [Thalictrum thalictroides]
MKIKSKFEGKDEYFIRNGAFLLEKQIASCEGKGIAIRIFTAEELIKATNNYDGRSYKGIATVYKGNLEGQIVAVKTPERLQVSDRIIDFFLNQVVTQIQINHKHVVKLFGCCVETEIPILVQDFMPKGSLSKHIANKVEPFPWCDRLRIATEIAHAVTYLHCVNSNPIIHRDIRATNILLDENYVAKLSNFGFSVVIPSGKTGIEIEVKGKHGYIDPEYLETSRLSEKCDVYGFGLLLLELLYWKIVGNEPSLVDEFIDSMENTSLRQILDHNIKGEGDRAQGRAYAALASKCIQGKGHTTCEINCDEDCEAKDARAQLDEATG